MNKEELKGYIKAQIRFLEIKINNLKKQELKEYMKIIWSNKKLEKIRKDIFYLNEQLHVFELIQVSINGL